MLDASLQLDKNEMNGLLNDDLSKPYSIPLAALQDACPPHLLPSLTFPLGLLSMSLRRLPRLRHMLGRLFLQPSI